MSATRKRKSTRNKQKLSPEEIRRRREDRRFKTDIRTVFTNAGFEQIPTRDVNITVQSITGDLDAVFVYDNIIVVVEDTTLKSVGDHLRKKAEFFDHLSKHHGETIRILREQFARFDLHCQSTAHHTEEYVVRFVYASRNAVDESYQARYAKSCIILTHSSLQYFVSLVKTIKRSARYELFKFLNVALNQLGSSQSRTESSTFSALQLPEVPSGFPSGHKLVSFLVDPATLLERAYVLRADSWRDREALYQRLLIKGKIASMRKYLVEEHRVFVNNIIVTLREDATYRATDASDLDAREATRISVGQLTIPRRFDAIGIIDGQHRVYAYHEGDDLLDPQIAVLRAKQHLLVTGIIYPSSIKPADAEAFEAKLFLEINDKQKRVKSDLKQDIELLINPCSDIAIAKAVLHRLAATGPLVGILALHFFDTGKLKTASIVSYGLRHIVGLNEPVSFFKKWKGSGKRALRESCDREVLDRYINFCGTELNTFIGAFKASQSQEFWTPDRSKSRLLTTTTVNGLVFCMRLILENDKLSTFDQYLGGFERLNLDFRPGKFQYKSSHWRQLGRYMYDKCFAKM